MEHRGSQLERLANYFAGLNDLQHRPLYNVTCVIAEVSRLKVNIKERQNLHVVTLSPEDTFASESGLSVLKDLRARNFNLAILDASASEELLH